MSRQLQDQILTYLSGEPGQCVADGSGRCTALIAAPLGIQHISALTAPLAELESQGLIIREIYGKRTKLIRLTADGIAAAEDLDGRAAADYGAQIATPQEPESVGKPNENGHKAYPPVDHVELALFENNDRRRLDVEISIDRTAHDVLETIAFLTDRSLPLVVTEALEWWANQGLSQPRVLELLELRRQYQAERSVSA